MTRIPRPARMLGLVAASGLLLAGCTTAGGGFIPTNNGAKNGKAVFGFTVTDEADGDVMRGSWTDGSVKFRFVTGGFDFLASGGCVPISGTYTSTTKPTTGQSGSFDLEVCDFGEPGPTSGDSIDLDPTSGPFSWYSNSGTLNGGNLKINSSNDSP